MPIIVIKIHPVCSKKHKKTELKPRGIAPCINIMIPCIAFKIPILEVNVYLLPIIHFHHMIFCFC